MKDTGNNITNHLYEFSETNPEKYALLHPEKVTFAGLCLRIDKYASGFLENGIKKGTKTIVLVSPGQDLFAVTFALLRIGAIPIMIDPGMGNRAMVRALSKTGAEAFIGIPKAHLLRLLFPGSFKSIQKYFSTGVNRFLKGVGLRQLRHRKSSPYEPCLLKPEETAAIFFTSGSTGPAKAVEYRSGMLQAQIQYMKDHFAYNSNEVDLCTFPLIGLLVITHGISVVMADMNMTKPKTLNPGRLVDNIDRFSCTTMFCSPMVLDKLANYGMENNCKLQSLKKVYTAGAPVSPQLLRNFRTLLNDDAVIHTPFGSTEALSVTDIEDRELQVVYKDTNAYLHGICVGTALKKIELRIIEISDDPIGRIEQSRELKRDEVGEIIVKGPNVTQRYMWNEQANRYAKIEDEITGMFWHRTGDLGRKDKEGRVWYYGRKSQRVISGGNTYFTIPCEAIFNQNLAVQRSALVGINNNGNVVPAICIELKKGIEKTTQLAEDLLTLAMDNDLTRNVSEILFYMKFPVDPRHNAKINREKLAVWAQKRLA
ncbi:MAG: AMP-binding protein [Bacteroidales bacterium]|nr:AMP-binding protein [Bacteroidales bacterium]